MLTKSQRKLAETLDAALHTAGITMHRNIKEGSASFLFVVDAIYVKKFNSDIIAALKPYTTNSESFSTYKFEVPLEKQELCELLIDYCNNGIIPPRQTINRDRWSQDTTSSLSEPQFKTYIADYHPVSPIAYKRSDKATLENEISNIKQKKFLSPESEGFSNKLSTEIKRIENSSHGTPDLRNKKVLTLLELQLAILKLSYETRNLAAIVQNWKACGSRDDSATSNYQLVSLQRRTGPLSIFNPKKTSTQQCIDSFLNPEEEPNLKTPLIRK